MNIFFFSPNNVSVFPGVPHGSDVGPPRSLKSFLDTTLAYFNPVPPRAPDSSASFPSELKPNITRNIWGLYLETFDWWYTSVFLTQGNVEWHNIEQTYRYLYCTLVECLCFSITEPHPLKVAVLGCPHYVVEPYVGNFFFPMHGISHVLPVFM